jgi:hypothetical protein
VNPAIQPVCDGEKNGEAQFGLLVGLQIVTRPHSETLALAIGSALDSLIPEARAVSAMA